MTADLADPPGALLQRRSRIAASALRAAYAWSERASHPEAMREVARMTGVIMEAAGPGHGPAGPVQLTEFLRRPLRELLSLARMPGEPASGIDEAIGGAVLLGAGDRLTDAAYDIACEYAQQLTQTMLAAAWLPAWTTMRAEQIQNETFSALTESGDQDSYVLARRFLIDHPASDKQDLSAGLIATGARCAARYAPLPPGQQYISPAGSWWWPCPVCKWPMTVTGDQVRCRYQPHRASYQAVPGRASSAPRLLRAGDRTPPGVPRARRAENAVCVSPGVWRFIVVPGTSEVRIAASLEKLGAEVRLWPGMDAYDLHVRAGRVERRLDVKEYRSVHRLIEDLRAKPPAVTVVLPVTHEHQRDALAGALPSVRVVTETALRRQIRQTAGRKR
jgi:REase associating with pPIWI_RE/pPIWI_RE three-gene island domain Y